MAAGMPTAQRSWMRHCCGATKLGAARSRGGAPRGARPLAQGLPRAHAVAARRRVRTLAAAAYRPLRAHPRRRIIPPAGSILGFAWAPDHRRFGWLPPLALRILTAVFDTTDEGGDAVAAAAGEEHGFSDDFASSEWQRQPAQPPPSEHEVLTEAERQAADLRRRRLGVSSFADQNGQTRLCWKG